VTARSGREPEVAGPGCFRASHADREHVLGILKFAYVQGMLTKDEFDQRVGQTLGSRTYSQLASVTADLPVVVGTAKSPRRGMPRAKRAMRIGAAALATAQALALVVPTLVWFLSGAHH
jgi:hypothetical protein